MTIEALMEEILSMSMADRERLVKLIAETLTASEPSSKKRHILEFEGVGAEIWRDIDAQDYVDRLRNEWDEAL